MDEARIKEFAERVAGDQSAAAQASLVALGDKLGLWAALAASGPVTPAERRGDQPQRALPARVAEHARSGRRHLHPRGRALRAADRARRGAGRRPVAGVADRRIRDQHRPVGGPRPSG